MSSPTHLLGTLWHLAGLHRPQRARRDIGRRLEFVLRLLPFAPAVNTLLRQLRDTRLQMLLVLQPTLPDKIRRPYLDRTWSTAQKTQVLCSHYQWLQQRFSLDTLRDLHRRDGFLLADLQPNDGSRYQLNLCMDRLYDKEGELVLTLSESGGGRIATLAFTVDATNPQLPLLRVAGLQGQREAGNDTFKLVTKQCHGLRPLPLLFASARFCAQAWDLAGVMAVSGPHHVCSHPRYGGNHGIQRSYDLLWEELGGELRAGWYWFPVPFGPRDTASIPSHKRAMYARRHAMLANLSGQIRTRLHQLALPAPADTDIDTDTQPAPLH